VNLHTNILFDHWLSALFERKVYKLIIDDDFIGKLHYRESDENKILRELKVNPVFLYAKVDSDLVKSFQCLENSGFKLVDTNVVFEKSSEKTHNLSVCNSIRFSVTGDMNQVKKLARNNFIYSRFHLDPKVPNELADFIKSAWAENYFKGKRGDKLIVAEFEGKVVGFLLLIETADIMSIDLIAVDRAYTRKGIATDMIDFAEMNSNCSLIKVGTQIANIPSCCFYEKLGFRIQSSQYVFHYHNISGLE